MPPWCITTSKHNSGRCITASCWCVGLCITWRLECSGAQLIDVHRGSVYGLASLLLHTGYCAIDGAPVASASLLSILVMSLGQHTDATPYCVCVCANARVFRCHDTIDQSQTDRSQLPLLVIHRARLLARCEMDAFRRDFALCWPCHSGSTPTRRHAAFACAQTHAYSVVMTPKISHKQTEASCRSWLFTEPACWRAAKWTLFAAISPLSLIHI